MPQEKRPKNRGLLSRTESPSSTTGRSWFFGIGINQYKRFPNLNNAVKDVQDIIHLLAAHYDLDRAYVITLFDGAATRKNIISTFDQLVKQVGPQDKLLIYYSGHGHLSDHTRKKRGFWIPTDAEQGNTAHYIRNTVVREYIDDIDSLHTLLISDACFSGSIFVRNTGSPDYAIRELAQRKSRWAICSGRHDEEVFDGDPGENSPFAASLLYLLNHNKEDFFNVAKLANEVVHLTRANYRQLPEGNPMYGVGHMGGQYVFQKKDADQSLSGGSEVSSPITHSEAISPKLSNSTALSKKNWLAGLGLALGILGIALAIWALAPTLSDQASTTASLSDSTGQMETREDALPPPKNELSQNGPVEKEEKIPEPEVSIKEEVDDPIPATPSLFQYTFRGTIMEDSASGDTPVSQVKIIVEGEEKGLTKEDGSFRVTWEGPRKTLIQIKYQKTGYQTFTETQKTKAADFRKKTVLLKLLTARLKKQNANE